MWEKAYNICFNTVQDNSSRWFQHKILNKILGTKAYRFKVKLSDNPLCSLCNQERELVLQETGLN